MECVSGLQPCCVRVDTESKLFPVRLNNDGPSKQTQSMGFCSHLPACLPTSNSILAVP